MLDANTEMFTSVAIDKTINYSSRLINVTKSQVGNLAEVQAETRQRNAAAVCSSPTTSIFIREFGAIYKYSFYSRENEYLFSYSLDREQCSSVLSRQ